MSEVLQPYEKIVQLKSRPTKGGGKLPPPFAAHQPYAKFVRLAGTWRKGGYNLYTPFAAQQAAHSTRDGLSRVDHIEHVLAMVSGGGRP